MKDFRAEVKITNEDVQRAAKRALRSIVKKQVEEAMRKDPELFKEFDPVLFVKTKVR